MIVHTQEVRRHIALLIHSFRSANGFQDNAEHAKLHVTAKLNTAVSTTAFKTYPSHHVQRKNKCLDYQQMAFKSDSTQ